MTGIDVQNSSLLALSQRNTSRAYQSSQEVLHKNYVAETRFVDRNPSSGQPGYQDHSSPLAVEHTNRKSLAL